MEEHRGKYGQYHTAVEDVKYAEVDEEDVREIMKDNNEKGPWNEEFFTNTLNSKENLYL